MQDYLTYYIIINNGNYEDGYGEIEDGYGKVIPITFDDFERLVLNKTNEINYEIY